MRMTRKTTKLTLIALTLGIIGATMPLTDRIKETITTKKYHLSTTSIPNPAYRGGIFIPNGVEETISYNRFNDSETHETSIVRYKSNSLICYEMSVNHRVIENILCGMKKEQSAINIEHLTEKITKFPDSKE